MEDHIAVLTTWSVQFIAAQVFLYVMLKVFKRVRYTGGKRPPGPPSLPLIGHFHHLLFGLPHHYLAKIAEKYGTIVWLELGAGGLKTQDHIFASRSPGIMSDLVFNKGQDLVFCPLNDHYRLARKIFTTELFSEKRIDSFKIQDMRRQMTFRTLRTAFEEGHANRYINLTDLLRHQFISLTTQMLFRMDGHAQCKDLLDIFHDILRTDWLVIEEFFPLLKPLDLSGQVRRLKNIGERYYEVMDSIIDNRLKENSISKSNTEEDFLDVLLATSKFSRVQIMYQISNFVLSLFSFNQDIMGAGTDSVSDTIVWAIIELLRHPNIMERLQSELDDVIGKERLVEEADLNNLEYLQAVVKETLRLHPVAALGVPHYSTEATKVAGYDIPANTRVMLNLYAIGRDAKVWKSPLKFDPSRFLNSPVDVRGQHYEVLPFDARRRRCVGMNLALLSMAYTVAQLIHACTISLPEGLTDLDVDVEEKFAVTVVRRNPLNLLIKRRLPLDVYGTA
ncbi:protein MpCYP829-like6 [Marchantia polymorpha subsp. ruderalis]|uniref:Cytochrome P450 n=1 Tax=Marchantia polymorpha TaxID=3197 RepID=A0A2R6WGD4_MARPO|nr:hypothetical protein MARPO_0094s0079 [Marchantia polymorpha]BBN02787.1 hypothetical protein Mp_2g18110 [Marchantia polymorpha subsp. ruderalis]|eukprot:PTQ32912.1 hypothetical protein MARPO_0094s0079 [Marchantia polymorpha]